MKLKPKRGMDRKQAIAARTLAVWESGAPDRRYQPRAYNAAGNWLVFDMLEQRNLTDDDLLKLSPKTLAEARLPTVH